MRAETSGAGEFQVGQLSAYERERYFDEDSEATLKNVALVAKLAALLVPFFSILDYFVYPELFLTFLALRISCVITILIVWFVSKQRFARKWYRVIATLIPLSCAAYISLMIFTVQDPGTPYYAGLILCLIAIGALLHWTFKEAIISTCLIIGMYLAVCLPALNSESSPKTIAYFVNNCVFVGASGLIVILGSYTHLKLRHKEFQTRMRLRKNRFELGEKHSKLEETLVTLRDTERQLYQSDKMSFLGELSAGVIHEIGNPLNFTNQALYALRKRLTKTGHLNETSEVVEDMQEGLDRIRGIVCELREFSHSGDVRGIPFPLSEAIQSALRMLNKPLEESEIEVKTELNSELKIVGVKNQITQVFTNLFHNAIQAMNSENRAGVLEIAIGESGEEFLFINISDNGPGISESDLENLFDPFFTTKDPGEGTGLGLSICYRIIEAHGGSIQVTSNPDTGTTFVIKIPKDS